MTRITGTHVYSYAKCPRLAALDLSLPRAERRDKHPWEAFAAARGIGFEDEFMAGLPVARPDYPERDFDRGAAATLALMQQGVPWIHQGVLKGDRRLGLPDLLRRVEGASKLGDHHYEVLDVKTSGHARGDQVLQVVFYTRLLAELQGRMPERGAIVLKTGAEEPFAVADYLAVAAEIETELLRLAEQPDRARPFYQAGCEGCHWSHRCVPAMRERSDLSLVAGMSHGARAILEANGCRTATDLATWTADARHTGQLDSALLRRLKKAAHAHVAGRPVLESVSRQRSGLSLDHAAIVHLLTDAYADRVLLFAVQHPLGEGEVRTARPKDRDEEWAALKSLLAEVPSGVPLLHFSPALPRWYEAHAFDREADVGLAARFVDLQRRLRAAALFPEPVFSLADMVRTGLSRDPLRAGHPGAAAMWLLEQGGEQKLVAKARCDVQDLADLKRSVLDSARAPA